MENEALFIEQNEKISYQGLGRGPKISKRVYDPIYGQIGFEQRMYTKLI